jgi:prolyl-tRNA editing enzyme YbaK/EbsC (Cys-tRNA(Pro) deacylase)
VATPGTRTIAEVGKLLNVGAERCVKTLIVDGSDGGVVALLIRGDHEMNAVKAQKISGVASPLRLSATPPVLRHAPPALGQHTDEVLAEWGVDAAQIAALRAAGVV